MTKKSFFQTTSCGIADTFAFKSRHKKQKLVRKRFFLWSASSTSPSGHMGAYLNRWTLFPLTDPATLTEHFWQSLSRRLTPPLFSKYTIAIHSAKHTHTHIHQSLSAWVHFINTHALTQTYQHANTLHPATLWPCWVLGDSIGAFSSQLFVVFVYYLLVAETGSLVSLGGHTREALPLLVDPWPETLTAIK